MSHAHLVITNAPAVGGEVYVRESNLSQHGLGLFAAVHFQPGDIVTWYDGFIIPKEDLWAEFVLYQPGSHTLTLDGSDFAVQGLQQPVEGWGGASFINHRPSDLANAKYLTLPARKHRLHYSLPAMDTEEMDVPMCVIVATQKIAPGGEIFCDYTFETCALLGIFYDHFSYHSPQ